MREMKDSGIPWVGLIPEGWKTETGKNFMKCMDRPVKPSDGVITCFRDGEVTLRSKRREEGFTISFQEIGYQGIEPGDLVVHGMDGFAGAIGISDSRGKATPVLSVIDTNQDKRFMMYSLRNMAYNDVFLALSTGIRVRSCDTSWKKLRSLQYALPPVEEQKRIADCIEDKLRQADALIANQQAQIEKLKQYKQSLITEVVTKGLDPNVPMKDSGVEWIGEMPKAWYKNKTIRIFGKIGSGTTPKGEEYYTDEGINWIQSGDINGGVIQNENKHVSPNALACFTALEVYKAPYLIMAMYGASVGNLSVSTIDACVNQACCVLRNPNIHFKYSYYALSAAKDYLIRQAVGGGQPNISQATIKSLWLPEPSLDDQKSIACFLDKACDTINSLVLIKQEKINNLSKYKKSLIYEYATGKKEAE